jgi:hypothetical protein
MQQEPGSITQWLNRLQAGQSQAAEPIWKRYQARVEDSPVNGNSAAVFRPMSDS